MYIPAELYADVKSDTDWLYTAGDKVTHMETGPGQFSVLDRDERVRFHRLVAVTSAVLLSPFQTLYNEPFLSRADAIASGFRFSKLTVIRPISIQCKASSTTCWHHTPSAQGPN